MKYLKGYKLFEESESSDIKKMRSLISVINDAEFTPRGEMVSLLSIYKCVVIKTVTPLQSVPIYSHGISKSYKTNWISIKSYSFSGGKFTVSFYPDESTAVENLNREYRGYNDFRDTLVLSYNEINYLEIENILSDYGIDVDEMWCIPLK